MILELLKLPARLRIPLKRPVLNIPPCCVEICCSTYHAICLHQEDFQP